MNAFVLGVASSAAIYALCCLGKLIISLIKLIRCKASSVLCEGVIDKLLKVEPDYRKKDRMMYIFEVTVNHAEDTRKMLYKESVDADEDYNVTVGGQYTFLAEKNGEVVEIAKDVTMAPVKHFLYFSACVAVIVACILIS